MDDLQYNDGFLILNNKNDIIMQKCAVEENTKFHAHKFIEIAYVASGHGTHIIEGGYSSFVEKGDLVLFNSDVSHAFRIEKHGQLTVYNCIFDPSVLSYAINKSDDFINIVYKCLFDIPEQRSEQKPYIVLNNAESVSGIINEMYEEYKEKQSGYEKVNAANLIRLLIAVFRLQMNNRDESGKTYRKAIADSAKEYMDEYYAEKITCESLASRAYLSTGYFHRIFKSVTGKSPIEYLQSVRLEKGARLITLPSSTVKQTALSVGYSDMKHFYNIFKKEFGVTPNEYKTNRKL